MRAGACAALALLGLALGLSTLSGADEHDEPRGSGFVVERAVLHAVEGRYVADARIHFGFSEDNVEAMRNGVALTVTVDIEVRRKLGWWWHETLAARKLRYRIETSVLTGRYRIRSFQRGATLNFRSFEEMVDALGDLESVPIIARDRLPADKRLTARIRARLDIEALPSPLRPIAYLSPRWRLDSGWTACRIAR